MSPLAELAAESVLADVVTEALDEISGRSRRRWAIVVLSLVVGATIAALVLRRRARTDSTDGGNDQGLSSPLTPTATSAPT